MYWRQCFWSQGPTQECSKDSQGQSQDGPSGPKMRVCACRSAHQWIGRTHIRAHRPETALPKTTQEPKGPPKAPESTQEPPQHAQTCTEGVVPATSATTLRHTSPGLIRRSRAQHFDGGGGVRAQRVLDSNLTTTTTLVVLVVVLVVLVVVLVVLVVVLVVLELVLVVLVVVFFVVVVACHCHL